MLQNIIPNHHLPYYNTIKPNQQNSTSLKPCHQSMPSLFAQLNKQKQTTQIRSIKELQKKINSFNQQQFYQQRNLKSLSRKFTLSPLQFSSKMAQTKFKLKNYQNKSPIQYDSPLKQNQSDGQDNAQRVPQNSYQISKLGSTRFTFLQLGSKLESEPKLSYKEQLSDMLITQSRLKYLPQKAIKNNKLQCRRSFEDNELSSYQNRNSYSRRSQDRVDLNETKSSFCNETFFSLKKSQSSDKNNELLNSTRTKIFFRINKDTNHKLTKGDIFPLHKLLEKRNRKLNFRNKWFDQKTNQQQQNI